jgi:hypothetical protein
MGERGQPIFDNVFVQQDAGLSIAHAASDAEQEHPLSHSERCSVRLRGFATGP